MSDVDCKLMLKIHTPDRDEPQHTSAENKIVSKGIHRFYFVKSWPCEDPKVKGEIEETENLIKKLGQEKIQILDKISEINAEREGCWKLKNLNYHYTKFEDNSILDERRYLQLVLDKLTFANNAYQTRPTKAHFSGEEFDKHKLRFRMLHGTKNLAEEKQILREIKPSRKNVGNPLVSLEQFEKLLIYERCSWHCYDSACKTCIAIVHEHKLTREKAIASVVVKGTIWNSFGSKHDLQNKLKLIFSELEELRAKDLEIKAKFKRAELNMAKAAKDVEFLKQKLNVINKTKDEAHQRILKLRAQISDENVCYDQYVSLLINTGKLAHAKNVKALEKISHIEVEKFMTKWNNSKEFRHDYMRRVSCSLENRELSTDGRVKIQTEMSN